MKEEGIKSLEISDKIAWIGTGCGIFFWFIESAIHSYVLEHGPFIQKLLNPTTHEAWMRGLIALMFITFGVYAQSIVNRRKKAEERLSKSEQFLSDIFESIQDGISVLDTQFTIRHVNNTMKNWHRENLPLVGKKCYEAYGNRSTPCEACPALRCTKSGQLEEEIVPGPPGSSMEWMQVFCYPIRDTNSGEVTSLVKFVHDITGPKKAEKELERYQTQLEELVRERTAKLLLTNERLEQEVAERRQTEAKLMEKARELEGINEQLRQKQDQLIQSEKMASIGQLAAGVAHEINNPVGFINSNLTTLDEYRGDLTELIETYLKLEELVADNPALSNDKDLMDTLEANRNLKDRIDLDFILGDFDKIIAESREGTERVKKIVQDLKNFSHVDQTELTWADLNKGMESTLNIVWNELKYKATVTKDYGDTPDVYCYPQRINQVFMNLLVNAAHAIEDKGEIKISTAHLDGAEPMVEVRISDTGKGIPPENLPRIFDPFFTTKPVGKGTGLGLSMAYNIIKRHDGEIKVESEVGKGTTFIIQLPVNGPKEGEGKTQ
ncbi:MAG: ATP-binding protein [Thermodesulfobacteriota bacterium]|nr:ATP-binding protein [Thermodesulfobacteriota bacterium]